jgi:hypothetical protein
MQRLLPILLLFTIARAQLPTDNAAHCTILDSILATYGESSSSSTHAD